jgi:hypothetical protein
MNRLAEVFLDAAYAIVLSAPTTSLTSSFVCLKSCGRLQVERENDYAQNSAGVL